jgi:hypothetical protein
MNKLLKLINIDKVIATVNCILISGTTIILFCFF